MADSNSLNVNEASQNTGLGLLAPTDVDTNSSSLTITVTGLPSYGTVTLADGTPVTIGETLTISELTSLQYDAPSAAQYNDQIVGAFTYSVSDGTNTVTGSTTITVNDSSEVTASADTASATEGYWSSSGSTTTTTVTAIDWSSSSTTDSNARNMNLQIDPSYGQTKSVSTSSVGSSGLVTVTADADHTASIALRADVTGYTAGDVVTFELVDNATGTVAQTIYWTIPDATYDTDDWRIVFGSEPSKINNSDRILSSETGISASGTYYIRFTATDNTNNGSDSTADLKGTIDEIRGITQYTATTKTVTISAPGVTWNAATPATGNVLSNDPQGSEGATVLSVSSAVDSSSNVATDPYISGNYGVLQIAANGAFTYTPNSDDFPANASDTFTYTIVQPDGDSATATLTINLTDHTYTGIYNSYTSADDNSIAGSANADVLYGGDGGDTIHGNGGNDIVMGGTGNDTLYGDAGQDRLIGGEGDDYLYAGTGDNDTDTSSNMLEGGEGADRLYGSGGSDYLLGGEGNDILNGRAGDDILAGGLGSDTLTGGTGVDVFKYQLSDLSASSTDTITDFKAGTYANSGDILDIGDVLQGAHPTTAAGLISGGYLNFGTVTNPSGTATFSLSIDPDGSSGGSYASTPLANFTMTGLAGSVTDPTTILQTLINNGQLVL